MKKKAQYATVEQILVDLTYTAHTDTYILVSAESRGGIIEVFVSDADGDRAVQGKTFRLALLEYYGKIIGKVPDVLFDKYEHHHLLDWSDVRRQHREA